MSKFEIGDKIKNCATEGLVVEFYQDKELTEFYKVKWKDLSVKSDLDYYNDEGTYTSEDLFEFRIIEKRILSTKEIEQTTCNHRHVEYNGLRDSFEYCLLCNERKI